MDQDLINNTQQQFKLAISELSHSTLGIGSEVNLNLAENCLRTIASSGNDELELEMAAILAPFKCRELVRDVEGLTEINLWEEAARKVAKLNINCREPQLKLDALTECQSWQKIAFKIVERKLGEFFDAGGVDCENQSITEAFIQLVHICNLLVLCDSQASTLLDGFEQQVTKFKTQLDLNTTEVPENDKDQIARLAGQLFDEEGSSHSGSILAIASNLRA